MSLVLVTGANGFIGSRLCRELMEHDYEVRAALRQLSVHEVSAVCQQVVVGDIGQETQWERALRDVDYVIHLAARVHVMKEVAINPQVEFWKVNIAGTMRLAEQAAELGVKRFIYISSIKVNGEETSGCPFAANDLPNPMDLYSLSKAEAERQLQNLSTRIDMEIVIVRPPLVYGPNVKGNWLSLLKLVEGGLPLPLTMIKNRRSMVSLQNLIDLLVRCLEHPNAVGGIFLVSDGVDWSTPELIRSIAHHLDVGGRLFPLPILCLRMAGKFIGKSGVINRLCNSLEIDIIKTRVLLDWIPPQSPDEGVQEAVKWYMENRNG